MRIAIDARIISSSTGRYIEGLVLNLEKIDHDNEYLILVRKKDLGYYSPSKPNFTVIEADFPDYSFSEQLAFAQFLYSLQVDLVHFCMPQQPLVYTRPAITTVHDLNLLRITANDDMGVVELRIKKIIFRILLWIVSHRSRKVIAPTNYTKQDLLRFSRIPKDKVIVTLEGADITDAEPQVYDELAGKEFIMYLGRAEPYKNNRLLIKAHQELLAKHPNLHLALVGKIDVFRTADCQWVEDNDYKNVVFTDFVSNEHAAWLYENCLAYVFPSSMEGFGLPGLEAMLYGAPVASSNATCLPEVYKDAAHYFDPSDFRDVVAKIDEVISNQQLRKDLKEKGKKVAASYSWRRMAKQTLAVYKEALTR